MEEMRKRSQAKVREISAGKINEKVPEKDFLL